MVLKYSWLLLLVVFIVSCMSISEKATVDDLINQNKIDEAYNKVMKMYLSSGPLDPETKIKLEAQIERLEPLLLQKANYHLAKNDFIPAVENFQRIVSINGRYKANGKDGINLVGKKIKAKGDDNYRNNNLYEAYQQYSNALICLSNPEDSLFEQVESLKLALFKSNHKDTMPGASTKKPSPKASTKVPAKGKVPVEAPKNKPKTDTKTKSPATTTTKDTKETKKTALKAEELVKKYSNTMCQIRCDFRNTKEGSYFNDFCGVVIHKDNDFIYIVTTYNDTHYAPAGDDTPPPYDRDSLNIRFSKQKKESEAFKIDLHNPEGNYIDFKQLGLTLLKIPASFYPDAVPAVLGSYVAPKPDPNAKEKTEPPKIYSFDSIIASIYSLTPGATEPASILETNVWAGYNWCEGYLKTSFVMSTEKSNTMFGGPVINEFGELLGIHFYIYESYSYAIPSDNIKMILNYIKNTKLMPKEVYLGIMFETSENYCDKGGITIDEVLHDSPAFSLLKDDDLIEKVVIGDETFDFTKQAYVDKTPNVGPMIRKLYTVGTGVMTKFYIKGKGEVVIASAKQKPEDIDRLMLTLDNFLSMYLGCKFDLTKNNNDPLVITKIEEGSWADEKGMSVGDKIFRLSRAIRKGLVERTNPITETRMMYGSYTQGESIPVTDLMLEDIQKELNDWIQPSKYWTPAVRFFVKWQRHGRADFEVNRKNCGLIQTVL